jgi:sulfur carrier protein
MTGSSPPEFSVNGASRVLLGNQTVADLVTVITGRQISAEGKAIDGTRLGIAVARNGEVISRRQWSGTMLEQDDVVEILSAAQGG